VLRTLRRLSATAVQICKLGGLAVAFGRRPSFFNDRRSREMNIVIAVTKAHLASPPHMDVCACRDISACGRAETVSTFADGALRSTPLLFSFVGETAQDGTALHEI
jgi:hypothetical protein